MFLLHYIVKTDFINRPHDRVQADSEVFPHSYKEGELGVEPKLYLVLLYEIKSSVENRTQIQRFKAFVHDHMRHRHKKREHIAPSNA